MHVQIPPPGVTIGLLGGGQLGRMMIQAAHRLGVRVAVLDPDPKGPAGQIADQVVVGAYNDPAALAELAEAATVFTTEFENVPASSLRFLTQYGPTYPSADCVEIAQDRRREKAFFAHAGVPVGPWTVVMHDEDLRSASPTLFPAILKTAELGYDGKGQAVVETLQDALDAFYRFNRVPCVLEQKLALAKEVSVILARSPSGEVAVFPVAENVHRRAVLDTSTVPAQIPEEIAQQACLSAQRIAETMRYVGVLGVEFFVLSDGQLLVNEMAPRPHNSGHFSIEACATSQFEQQVRICADIPLGPTTLKFPVRMTNLLGDLWFPKGPKGPVVEPDFAALSRDQGSVLHLYGKSEPRPGRKMGHITQPWVVA
jgi:5-(carboxyamino)imidazole ribonucleotide synthase